MGLIRASWNMYSGKKPVIVGKLMEGSNHSALMFWWKATFMTPFAVWAAACGGPPGINAKVKYRLKSHLLLYKEGYRHIGGNLYSPRLKQTNIIIRILMYSGVIIQDVGVVQVAAQQIQNEQINSKS